MFVTFVGRHIYPGSQILLHLESFHLHHWAAESHWNGTHTGGQNRICSLCGSHNGATRETRPFLVQKFQAPEGKPSYSHLHTIQQMSRCSGIFHVGIPMISEMVSWPQMPKNSVSGIFLMFRQFGHCSWISKVFKQIHFLGNCTLWGSLGATQERAQRAHSAHVPITEAQQFICRDPK